MSENVFTLPFKEKKLIAPGVHAFHFDKTSHPFDFKPGQYIRMTIPHENSDQRGISRYFSIAITPTNTSEMVIMTKDGESSFKKKLLSLEKGDIVTIRGPFGDLVLDETSDKLHVMLSGGIGLTPLISMIEYIQAKKLCIPVLFIGSYTTPEEIILKDMFEKIQSENPQFQYVPTVTHPEQSKEPWNGQTGRISKELLEKYIPNVKNCIYYIVGPEAMNHALSEVVYSFDISDEQVKLEDFSGY